MTIKGTLAADRALEDAYRRAKAARVDAQAALEKAEGAEADAENAIGEVVARRCWGVGVGDVIEWHSEEGRVDLRLITHRCRILRFAIRWQDELEIRGQVVRADGTETNRYVTIYSPHTRFITRVAARP